MNDFIKSIEENPKDLNLKLIFCDWLEENGFPWTGDSLRNYLLGEINKDFWLRYGKEFLKDPEFFAKVGGKKYSGWETPVLYGCHSQKAFTLVGYERAICIEAEKNDLIFWHATQYAYDIRIPIWKNLKNVFPEIWKPRFKIIDVD